MCSSDIQLDVFKDSFQKIIDSLGYTKGDVAENTALRAAKGYSELLSGKKELEGIKWCFFDVDTPGQIVFIKDIPFFSTCEHHLLPFFGTVTIGYIPNNRVVGLSKIPRLVAGVAHQLQLQERMNNQIASELMEKLNPLALGVYSRAQHLCMSSRGSHSSGFTTTLTLKGLFQSDSQERQKFLDIMKLN